MVRVHVRHAGKRLTPVFRVAIVLFSVMATWVFLVSIVMPGMLCPSGNPDELG